MNDWVHDEEEVYEYKKFTEEDYRELERNLILYKQGNAEAVTYICQTFHQFIRMYARFIHLRKLPCIEYTDKHGNTHHKINASIASFVSLFKNKKELEGLDRGKQFSVTCLKIQTLFSKYEYDDIYNELVLAVLNMANKYQIREPGDPYYKKNGTFHMYIMKCFHWEAHAFLKKLIKDPLAHLEIMPITDNFNDIDAEDTESDMIIVKDDTAQLGFERIIENETRRTLIQHADTLTMKEPEDMDAFDIEALNFNWTNGVTCSPLFKILTSYERELIILYYIKKMSDAMIANMYGRNSKTISNQRRAAVRKLRAMATDKNLIGDD